jgi:DNA-binding transcriptional regulator YiaG
MLGISLLEACSDRSQVQRHEVHISSCHLHGHVQFIYIQLDSPEVSMSVSRPQSARRTPKTAQGTDKSVRTRAERSTALDYERLASELLRALRGERSQTAFSRRLGYRSNIVYSWEAGRAFPTAARALWAAQRIGVDVQAALLALYRKPPGAAPFDPTTAAGVAQFLTDLRGRTTVQQIAATAGSNRFAVARWFKGATQPRLPDFLRLVEATSLRLLDLLGGLVDPAQLPSVRGAWQKLELARAATYREPWSQAVLRALELSDYHALQRHEAGWIAQRLRISVSEEARALELLLATDQIRRAGARYEPAAAKVVDTRRDPEGAHALRVFWSKIALERLNTRAEGLFSHGVFGVSEAGYQRLRELQKAYYQEARSIVAESHPVERVALLNLQLVPLG